MIRGAIILFAGIVLVAVGLALDGDAARLTGMALVGFGTGGTLLWGRKP